MTGLIKKVIIILCAMFLMSLPVSVKAEIKIIETESSYIMGDNDSKIDARRIATQEAKRKALEMAGAFMESLTEVKNMALAKDEIKAYTAGVVETDIISEDMKGTSAHPEIFIRARCKIDTSVLIGHINSFRKNEDLKEQLNSALKENESLKKERDSLTSKLSTEKDKSKAEDIRMKLGNVLAKEEANDEIKKVWGNLAQRLSSEDAKKDIKEMNQKELDEASAVLKKAVKINPENTRAHMLLALIYHKKGDIAGAEKQIRTAIATNPDNPLFHMRLGLFLKDNGKYTEALREFNTVERLRPNKPDLLFHTGMTYKALNNCSETVSYLKRFLVITKRNEGPLAGMKAEAIKALKECRGEGKKKPVEKRPFRQK